MYFPKLTLTNAGCALIIKGLQGKEVNFSKMTLGSGVDPGIDKYKTLSALIDPKIDIAINSITPGEGLVELEGSFDNATLSSDIIASEFGVYADDPDDGEILYAYANAGENAAYLPAYSTSAYERVTFRFEIVVGDAEHVTATIGEYSGYARQEDFKKHVSNESNPHKVTKEQVGLGNVPNVSTNNQTPSFPALSPAQQKDPTKISLTNITSGETLSVMFGKVRNVIARMIHHLSANNPHNITKSTVGLSNVDNTSDAEKPVSKLQSAALNEAVQYCASLPYFFPSNYYLDTSSTIWPILDLSRVVFQAPITLIDLSDQINDGYDKVEVRISPESFMPGSELRVSCSRVNASVIFSYKKNNRIYYITPNQLSIPVKLIAWGINGNGEPLVEVNNPTMSDWNDNPPSGWWA